jgi:hypothetical protein
LLGVLVRIDEATFVGIEHHDGLRRMIHEQSVARLTLAHGLLGLTPLGHVTQT